MLRPFIGMVVLVCGSMARAGAQQPCALRLQARSAEAHTDDPVFPAMLYIDELRQSFEADTTGFFALPLLCAGRYTIHATAAGHRPVTEVVDLVSATSIHLHLPHDENTLREVVAVDSRVGAPLQERQSLGDSALRAGSGKTLAGLLEAIPGVTTFSNGATVEKPVIHGLSGNRILMLNNGVRQEDQQWGTEHAPTIDPFTAGTVTVVKGAAGVRYGTDAIAGIVLVEPAPLRQTPGWSGAVDAAAFTNNRMGVLSGQAEHRFTKAPAWAFRLQGTLKRGGNYQLPSGAWAANTGVGEGDFSVTLGHRSVHRGTEFYYSRFVNDLGIYRGSHAGSAADLQNAVASPEPLVPASFTYTLERPRQHVVHQLVRIRSYADTRAGLLTATAAYQHNLRQEYDVQRVETDAAQLNLRLQTATLNMNLDHKQLGPVKGSIGVDGLWQRNRFDAGDRVFVPFYDAYAGGAYVIERYKRKRLVLEAGGRFDHRIYDMLTNQGSAQTVVPFHSQYSSFSGILGAQYTLRPEWTIQATAARAWRAPQAVELFAAGLHQGVARIELGNQALVPEASYSATLSTDWKWKTLSAHLSVYSQWVNNFIYLEPGADILTIRGYYKTFRYQQTDALLQGADLSASWQATGHFSLAVSGSVLRAHDRRAGDWIILMPSDRGAATIRYGFSYRQFQNSFLSATARLVARQTRIPANFDAIDAPRPPAGYTLFGISAGSDFSVCSQPFRWSVSLENAFNTRYREYLDAFRYFLDRPGRNVVVRLHIPFNPQNSKPSQS